MGAHHSSSTEEQLRKSLPNDQARFIFDKIISHPLMKQKVGKKLKEACVVFSDAQQMRKLYLNTDWVESMKYYGDMVEEDNKKVPTNSIHEGSHVTTPTESTSSTMKHLTNKNISFSSQSNSTEDIDNIVMTFEEYLEKYGNELSQQTSMMKSVKIKLVIAEVSHTQLARNFRMLISPILAKLELQPEFGMFHSAIMIGPWLIDWNDSGICIPRKCVSQAALLSADLDSIGSEQQLEDIIDKLATKICEWNGTKTYSDTPKNKKTQGNCQDFVNDILQAINVSHDFKGALAMYIKTLREKGKSKMEFTIPDGSFAEKFKLKEKKIEFPTHEALDKFVSDLCEADIEFRSKYKDEWALLKSFDRAFWLKHYKFKDKAEFCPLPKSKNASKLTEIEGLEYEDSGCPMLDPRYTGSIKFT